MSAEHTPEAQRLLDAAVDVILERGLWGLSLSALARAIGSNNRMLLYYFGSKDGLLTAAVQRAYERFPELAGLIPSLQGDTPLGPLLCAGWRRLRAPENVPYLRLFFDMLTLTIREPAQHPAQLDVLHRHWPAGIQAAFVAHGWGEPEARLATLQVLALWRGLQAELLTGGDPAELDAAHDAAVGTLFPPSRQ
ncbi:TetR/AcrR family transcriptional regulator [Microbacterium sp. SORGH_AS_0888]|uniref:TetR/AcrR family transcriptional regulator n=1 Tax=Microbacterium sp. SORGH_AS_0888 TaxID=3041791 RepID=UPI0027889F6A|nr:TetR/AcrR family transcriptional regulator [Microbacterium sp. SORGH_AS_0888]MDQ1129128.1 AcrR family transcriptional regulator [Microbacterium sp. SORGH_AS_0888]